MQGLNKGSRMEFFLWFLDCRTKTKSKLGDKLNLTVIPESLIITWCKLGCPIFRQIVITIDLVETWHSRSGFRSQNPKPAIAAPRRLLVINRAHRLTSPRRVIPACELKNTSKNKEERNWNCRFSITLEVGVSQTDERRNCSKTD